MNATQKTGVDLTVVITAHNEGLIAHKTMLSVADALDQLNSRAITYEVLISVDSGDTETREYFSRYKATPNYRVIDVDFKGLSQSRNNAIKEAEGDYVSFLDADDLISSNWLLEGYLLAKKTGSIAHPEYSITFGDDNLMWRKISSNSLAEDTLCLIDNNLWDSPCLAHKDIFTRHPYIPNGNGYGFEDKQFNSETLADAIAHVVVPKTILFVRRKNTGSMLQQAVSDRVTLAPTKLLSYEVIRSLDLSPYLQHQFPPLPSTATKLIGSLKSEARRYAKKVHNQAKHYELYTKAIQPLREKHQAHILTSLIEQYPTWMTNEWRRIHQIDNTIFPSKELLKHLRWYNSRNTIPGIAYTQLVQSFSKKPDTLMFVPHLIKGGADMLFINYPNELSKIHPSWHIAMLQTEQKESVWRDKVNPSVDFIDIYKLFQGLDQDTQFRLLATLVTQNGIKRIIIGNSQLAYDFISKYTTLIKRLDIAVYCFAFGEEFDEEGRLWGHIHTGIPRIYPVIHRIITDNKNTVNKLEREYSFSPNRFSVHYQPTSVTVQRPIIKDHQPLRILWASRVCKQKRPDILKRVSNLLDPNEFTIDAYGQLEEGITPEYFNESRVSYKGPFNGVASLPTDQYDIFLYTSEGDGVPNVLQEMTANGLPIVASNVGGIREFIKTDETGILIEDHNNIEDYVKAMLRFKDPDLRKSVINGAQNLLKTQFSHDTWAKNIKQDFDK